MATSYRPLDERFWEKVDKTGDCWLWTSPPRSGGYGGIGEPITGRMLAAHRVSWELHYGPIPDGLCVLHQCDVRLCVRPDHLFLGTKQDNTQDMIAKSREHFPFRDRPGFAQEHGQQPGEPSRACL